MARTSGNRISVLLLRGQSVSQVAAALKCTRRWVYDYARRHDLPRNVPIRRNSTLENKIAMALLQNRNDYALVSRLFSQAEPNLRALVRRLTSATERRAS